MILVTGASGFLGSHLVQQLSKEGVAVRALYYSTPPTEDLLALPHVTWQQADLLDVFAVEKIMENVQWIYHCAAIVSFDGKDKEALVNVNVASTANVVNAALEAGVQKLLYVSSIASLGRSATQKEIDEQTEWEDSSYNSVYSKSKYLAEMEVWRGMAEGLNAVIINPGIILGIGDWEKGSTKLIQTAYKEFPFYTDGVNGWVAVKDVVAIAQKLMQSNISEERFIVTCGNYSYKEIFSWMAEALHKKPPTIKAGKLASGLVWRWNALRSFFTGKTATITKETATTAQKQSYYNNQKILTAFPEFTFTPIQETIRAMAVSFLESKA